MPKFLLKFNAAVIKEVPITKESLSIGRKEDNDIVIDNPAVSSHHCKFYLAGDIFYIEDLNSTNGTYVNGKRIIKAGIHHNDIIGIVKHALVFIDDRPSANPTNVESSKPQAESTMVLSNDHKNLLATAGVESAKKETVGLIKVVEGIVDKTEYLLTGLSTYIGKSDRVQIPIKGSGLFGNAPEVAAMIARRPDGYYLVAMKEGYPKLNGKNLTGRELLKEGDLIELGSTIFQFFIQKEANQSSPPKPTS